MNFHRSYLILKYNIGDTIKYIGSPPDSDYLGIIVDINKVYKVDWYKNGILSHPSEINEWNIVLIKKKYILPQELFDFEV